MLTHLFPLSVYVIVVCTAYTPAFDECGKTDAITASGIKAVEGRTIASDDLPFGTKVEIDGKVYTVEDRFGGGYKNRIDIFMENKSDAFNFGRQTKVVKILKAGEEYRTDTRRLFRSLTLNKEWFCGYGTVRPSLWDNLEQMGYCYSF